MMMVGSLLEEDGVIDYCFAYTTNDICTSPAIRSVSTGLAHFCSLVALNLEKKA